MKLLYTVQYNVMYKYIFYHALYSVRVSISYYVLHVAMLVLLIDYSSKYKSYASESFLYSGTATQYVCMYVWSSYSRVWINRVRLPILLVVS